MTTLKQRLVSHLKARHPDYPFRATQKALVEWHTATHQGYVLTHNHNTEGRTYGYVDGSDQRPVRLCLIKPKNPSSSKAEDRNWTLQIGGHENACIIQFMRLYGTRNGDAAGAVIAAEQSLGYSPGVWSGPNQAGSYEVKE